MATVVTPPRRLASPAATPVQTEEATSRLRLRAPTTRELVTGVHVLVVLACCAFTWLHIAPHWVLTNTTPAGGDMGAHVWGPAWLRDHLLPQGRITGWSPDWYEGFPAMEFYFPLPSLGIALLSHVIPYNIAFKLVSVSGVVLLPVAAAAFGALSGMRRPYAACLAIGTIPFLFDPGFTIYGGNVASTLAGEFSFAISLCFALVFLGLLAKSLDTGRYRGWAALAFGCCLLSHILPAIFAVAAAVVMTLIQPAVKRFWAAASVGIAGGAIACFWLLPFQANLPYTNDMGWEKVHEYLLPLIGSSSKVSPDKLAEIGQTYLQPQTLRLVFWLALGGAFFSIILQRRVGTILTYVAALAALAFRFMPGPSAADPYAHGKLWNARMLPFWYLCLYLLAACLFAEVAMLALALWRMADRKMRHEVLDRADQLPDEARALAAFAGALGWPGAPAIAAAVDDLAYEAFDLRDRAAARRAVPQIVVPVLGAFIVLGLVAGPFHDSWLPGYHPTTSAFVDSWAKWNYVGYEGTGPQAGSSAKPRKDEMFDLIHTMSTVGQNEGCGRSLWEYEPEIDKMGTPLALMLLPYWTHGCIGSSEGLYFESSATTPAHFLTAGSVTENPSNPERGLPYTSLDLSGTGIARMQLLGIRYYIAISDEAKAQADADPRLHAVAETATHEVQYGSQYKPRTWRVYEIADSDLVEPVKQLPVVVQNVPNSEPAWKALADRGWFAQPTRLDQLLAQSGPKDWPRVKPAPAAAPVAGATPADPLQPLVDLGASGDLPSVAVDQSVRVTDVDEGDSRLSFHVDKIGVPMLVKESYFPNWKASGAKGPYRVSPNFMVVIPTSHTVVLRYGRTPIDWLGTILTLSGLASVVVLNRRRLFDRSTPGLDRVGSLLTLPTRGSRRSASAATDGRIPPEGEAEGGQAADRPRDPGGDGGPGGAELLDADRDAGGGEPGPLGSQDQLGVEQVGAESALLDQR